MTQSLENKNPAERALLEQNPTIIKPGVFDTIAAAQETLDRSKIGDTIILNDTPYVIQNFDGADYINLEDLESGETFRAARNQILEHMQKAEFSVNLEPLKSTSENIISMEKAANPYEGRDRFNRFFRNWETKGRDELRDKLNRFNSEISKNVPDNELRRAIKILSDKFAALPDDKNPDAQSKPLDRKELATLSIEQLQDRLYTVKTSLEARAIVDELRGKRPVESKLPARDETFDSQPGNPELIRLKALVIMERDYLNKEVTFQVTETGKDGKIIKKNLSGKVIDIVASKRDLRIKVKTKEGGIKIISPDQTKLEGENTTEAHANTIISKYLSYDTAKPFFTAENSSDGDDREAYKLKKAAWIRYSVDERKDVDGGIKVKDGVYENRKDVLKVLGVYIRNGNPMGYIVERENGEKITVTHDELASDIQRKQAFLSEKEPKLDDKKPDEKIPTPEKMERGLKIGTFVRPKNGGSIFEVVNISEQDGKSMVTIKAFDDRGSQKEQILDTVEEPLSIVELEKQYDIFNNVDGISGRHQLAEELRGDFLEKAKSSFDNKGALNKFKFEFARMIRGEEMESGLSKEARESWDTFNSYLNKLNASAEREWQNKGYDPEKIEALKKRYKAMYISGMQLELDYDDLYEQKTKMTETRVGRTLGKIKDVWNKIPTKWKVFGSIAAVATVGAAAAAAAGAGALAIAGASAMAGGVSAAGMLGSSTVTKKAGKTWGAWAGLGLTQGLRGLMSGGVATPIVLGAALTRVALESYHVTKADPKEMAAIRTSLNELYSQTETIQRRLKDPKITAEQKTALEAQLATAQSRFTMAQEIFDQKSGQLDQDMLQAEEKYNRHEITAKEYREILQKRKMHDELMETLKKGVTIFALGTAVASGVGHMGTDDTINPIEHGDHGDGGGDHGGVEDVPVEHAPTYDNDAIVRQGEGVTHAYERQLDHNPELVKVYEEKLGMDYSSDKGSFLARLAREHGYIDSAGNDVRVGQADVSAYALNMDGTNSEFHNGEFVESHKLGDLYESNADKHEYNWNGSPQHKEGLDPNNFKSSPMDSGGASTSGSLNPDDYTSTPMDSDGAIDTDTVKTGSLNPDDYTSTPMSSGGADTEVLINNNVDGVPLGSEGTIDPSTIESTPMDSDGTIDLDSIKSTPMNSEGAIDSDTLNATDSTPAPKMGPGELLTSKVDVSADILQSFDKFDEGLSEDVYNKLINTPVSHLTGSSDLSVNESNLASIVNNIKANTNLEPYQYESAHHFINRGLEELGSPATIDQIHLGQAYVPLTLEASEFVGATKQQTYNNFMDLSFDKVDGDWKLEGGNISFKDDIATQSARDIFFKIGQGDVTADTLKNGLNLTDVAAAKLFDFFVKVKSFTEDNVGMDAVSGSTSMAEIVRKMTDAVTDSAK